MTAPRMASIVVNASDIEAVAGFWKGLLDVQERNRLPGFIWLERQEGTGVSLAVQQVDEPTPGRNRLHLDLGSPDLPATHERIVELGGSELEQHSIGDFGWTVFADPEGNEFCVAQADPDDYA